MSAAKQARRIATMWATILGELSGIENVDDFATTLEYRDDDRENDVPNTNELLATIAHNQLGWDEGAADAGAAGLDRCPKGFEQAYYRAYQIAAVARVHELTA